MDYIGLLPPEILGKIFLELSTNDLESIEKTSEYWRDIIKHQKLWQIHWKLMLDSLNSSIIKPKICNILKKKTINETVPRETVIRLKNILHRTNNKNCFFNHSFIQQHSRTLLLLNAQTITIHSFLLRQYPDRTDDYCRKISLDGFPRCLNRLMQKYDQHTHRQKLYFCYTMENGSWITKELIKYLFEEMHVMKILFLPISLFYSLTLGLLNSIVIYSSEFGTEVSVIVNCKIIRWKNLLITGNDIMKENRINNNDLTRYSLFDTVIMELLTGLKTEEINSVLKAVYFMGSYFEYVPVISGRLQNQLREKYPECKVYVNFCRSSDGVYHCNEQVLHCHTSQVSTTKYKPGIPFRVDFTDYVLDGLQHFDS